MKFSVLMCCNRDDGYLGQAIESVLAQSYDDFEFLIILNNCSDALYEFVSEFTDPRIVLRRTKIGQLAFNLNVGIDLAVGEFIVRFDADDVCHPDRLQKTAELLSTHPDVDIIAGSCRLIDEGGRAIGAVDVSGGIEWRKALRYGNPFVHPALAIRTTLLVQMRGYSGGFQSEDYELWLRLAERTDVSVITSAILMIDYRINSQQSRGSRLAYAEVASYFLKHLLNRPRISMVFGLVVASLKVFTRGVK